MDITSNASQIPPTLSSTEQQLYYSILLFLFKLTTFTTFSVGISFASLYSSACQYIQGVH